MAKCGEISFYPLESQKTTFSANFNLKNVHFQNPGAGPSPFDTHDLIC